MLQDIRDNAQGTIAKVIVGLIIVTFALFGVESLVSLAGGEPEVAEVDGEGITQAEFERAVESQRRQILSQMGENADPALIDEDLIRQSVLEGLIAQRVLLNEANNNDFAFSRNSADALIVNLPQFQRDGVFDPQLFEITLGNIGQTPNSFRQALEREVKIAQSRNGLQESSFVLPSEVQQFIELDRQTRDLAYLTISAEALQEEVSISEDDIQDYYDSNLNAFLTPEQVKLSYVELTLDTLTDGIEVSEDDARARYEEQKTAYVSEEERRAAHILVAIDDDVSEAAAEEKIAAIQARLEAGEAFGDLAKELSDDPGSARDNGDLGFTARGAFVPEFEEALFALDAEEVSAPVRTQFGIHLIKLLDVQQQELAPFEELYDTLVFDIRQVRAQERFVEISAGRLADIAFQAEGLEEVVAEVPEVTLHSTDFFTRDGGPGLLGNPRVLKEAFSEALREGDRNSDVIELGDGRAVVIHVEAYQPEAQQPLEDVRESIVARLTREQARELATAKGEEALDKLQSGISADVVAAGLNTAWKVEEQAGRNTASVDRRIVQKAFALPKPEDDGKSLGGVSLANGDYALVSVTKVDVSNAAAATEAERNAFNGLLGRRYGNSAYQDYVSYLTEQADIERDSE